MDGPDPEGDAAERRRAMTGRVVRPGDGVDPFDDAFDRAFWRAMTGEQRVEALWAMVLDALEIQGRGSEDEPRQQRSVGSIRRPRPQDLIDAEELERGDR